MAKWKKLEAVSEDKETIYAGSEGKEIDDKKKEDEENDTYEKAGPLITSDSKQNRKKKRITTIRVVKGFPVLIKLQGFDMIWSFFRDYLHADLIGDALILRNI